MPIVGDDYPTIGGDHRYPVNVIGRDRVRDGWMATDHDVVS